MNINYRMWAGFFIILCACLSLAGPVWADDETSALRKTDHQRLYESFPRPPYLAVYQKGDKKLVVLAAKHGAESLPSVQYAFDSYNPQVVLVEREPGEPFGGACTEAEDAYTAALASQKQIPLVRTDMTLEQQWQFAKAKGFTYKDWQMLWMIREGYGHTRETEQPFTPALAISTYAKRDHHPQWGSLFTEKTLNAYFKKHYKQVFAETDFIQLYQDLMNLYPEEWVTQTPFWRLHNTTGLARSQFMLHNIAAALSQYDVVFAEMGAGHYLDLVPTLKEMLGSPQVIDGAKLPAQTLWKDCEISNLSEIVLIKK